MSGGHVKPALISAIAESLGITDLSDDGARVLAPDVEYRVRDILQEAAKFSRHACRRRLECQDVNHALQVRDMEQMYGFTSSDRRRYSQVAGAPDAFRLDDTLHRCEDVINHDLPPTPVDAGLQMHWFLVNGMKPRIPENEVPRELIQWHQDKAAAAAAAASQPVAAPEPSTALVATAGAASSAAAAPKRQLALPSTQAGLSTSAAAAHMGSTHAAGACALDKDGKPVTLLPVVRHSLTEELHALLKLVTQVLLNPTEPVSPDHPVFASLSADSGINPILPYVVAAIKRGGDERASLNDLPRLWRLLWAASALVRNSGNSLSAQLPQLLPALLSLLVTKRIGQPGDDHWSFRMHTARCLAALADRFPATELEVRARIARVCEKILEKAASDRAASGHLAACFGAAVGLQAMGMQLVRMLLLPALPAVMRMLLPCMNRVCTTAKERTQQADAWQCMGAMQTAICAACRDGVMQSITTGAAALSAARLGTPKMNRRWDSESWKTKQRGREAAIDKRILEIERESENRLLEERERKRQALGQEARLQAVEAAARTTIDTPPGTPAVDGAGTGARGGAVALSERERVVAAARAAAQNYDPSGATAGGVVVEIDGEGNNPNQSPPGSPVMIIPPPPRSPPSKPSTAENSPAHAAGAPQPCATGTAAAAAAAPGQQSSQPQAVPVQRGVQNGASPLTATAGQPANEGMISVAATSSTHPFAQPVLHSNSNGAAPNRMQATVGSSALTAALHTANGASGSQAVANGSGGRAPNTSATTAANGQPRQPQATAENTVQNLQHTGANGVVGTDRLNGQAHQGAVKHGSAAETSKAVQQGSAVAGSRHNTESQSGVGSSDREGDDLQSKGAAVVAIPESGRSSRASNAHTNVNTSPGSTEALAGPSSSSLGVSEEGVVGVREGCIACTAGERCVLHDMDALGELKAKLEWASREGKAVSVHVETAYEVFGEAVLQWMPLAWLGETIV